MPAVVQNISFSPGYMTLHMNQGPNIKHPMTEVLRALDIPDLTIDSLTLLTTLAQVVMVLISELEEQGILEQDFASGYDMEYMKETLIDDLEAEGVDSV